MSLAAQIPAGFSPEISNGTKPPASSESSNANRAAWQREMERAMSDAWFRHPLLPGAFEPDQPPALLATNDSVQAGDRAPVTGPRARGHAGKADTKTVTGFDGDSQAAQNGNPSSVAGAPGDSRSLSDVGPTDSVAKLALPYLTDPVVANSPMSQTTASSWSTQADASQIPVVIIAASIHTPAGASDLLAQLADKLTALTASTASVRAAPLGAQNGVVPADADLPDPTVEEETSRTAGDAPSIEEPAQPLRMHAEWTEHGVRLWLGAGVNSDMNPPQLTQQMMQWLGEQGVRLLSLVLNGRTVYRSPSNIADVQNETGLAPSERLHSPTSGTFAERGLTTYFYQQEA